MWPLSRRVDRCEGGLDQMHTPELSIEQAILGYKRLGYSDKWINSRIRGIEVRKVLTAVCDLPCVAFPPGGEAVSAFYLC